MRRALGLIAMPLLAACAQADDAPRLRIADAQIEARGDAVWLIADCRWQPSEAMVEALEHGIALTLAVRVQAPPARWFGGAAHSNEKHLELRYFPLTRQYQWRNREDGNVRSYAVRSSALSALERLELPLGKDFQARQRGSVRIEFDTDALPGALHLPTLLQAQWRQAAAEFTWPG